MASSVDVLVDRPFEDETVCIVTIDEESGKNLVVWEKTPDVNIALYRVYGESKTAGVYNLLGEVSVDSLSTFLDNGFEPLSYQQKYRITSVDNCGNESLPSEWHKPMFLQSSLSTDNKTINLFWTEYRTQSIASYQFVSYVIYRSTTIGSLEPIDTIPADNTQYSDTKAPVGVQLYYYIAGLKSNPCDPANLLGKKASSGPFVHSLSNLEDNKIQGTGGIENPISDRIQLAVYPSPFVQQSSIDYTLQETSRMKIEIYNAVGEKIKDLLDETQPAGRYRIALNAADVNNYPGVYYLKVHVNDETVIRKTMLTR